MKRGFEFSTGQYYHVYNRGTDKRVIFTEDHDYNRFLMLLYICNSKKSVDIKNHFHEGRTFVDLFEIDRGGETIVDIGAYCLMPNHFHLLIKEKIEDGLTNFMRKVSTGYSMYFNKKFKRTGSLFEGKFKATHANNDGYLKYLFAYIHLNPIKNIQSDWKDNGIHDKIKAINYLNNYHFSSGQDYNNKNRHEKVVLRKESFPDYFENRMDFNEQINFWIDYNQDKSRRSDLRD